MDGFVGEGLNDIWKREGVVRNSNRIDGGIDEGGRKI